MRTAEVTITMLLCKIPDTNINMNQTHIDLKIISIATPQENRNVSTRHQRGNQQQQVRFIQMILC